MKLTVQLRVVGIYFNTPITFESANPTIASLMYEASKQLPIDLPGGFAYTSTLSTDPSVVSVSHNYSGRFDFDGNGSSSDPVDGPTLRGITLPAGIYELKEQSIADGLVGWQYYVVRDNQVVSTTPASRGFLSYAKFLLQDGDKVIWRLVGIAKAPVKKTSRYERLAVIRRMP
jgi:hypothetical protein